jgi:dihydroorotate dehydrogenase electron transfer subunit
MGKTIQDLEIIKNISLNSGHVVLELRSDEPLPDILPGQFAEVLVPGTGHVFLRRPLSFHDADFKHNTFRFLVKIVGEGTERLSRMEPGERLNVIYPLGKGFSIIEKGDALLVGGGCGVAPLLFLARKLRENGIAPVVLLGARTKTDVLEAEEFEKLGKVLITTDDGSFGEKGFITQHSIWKTAGKFSRIYCCGPEIMMKAVAALALEKGADCEVSLEHMMACGIGACLCCVTDTIRGNECVCTSGPVFNIKELKWQT